MEGEGRLSLFCGRRGSFESVLWKEREWCVRHEQGICASVAFVMSG